MQKNARKDAGYFSHAPITIWFYLLLQIFIVKGIIISFFCSLNSKMSFFHLICQFTKNLFFQIQERIQLFKTDTVYKMSSYFFPVIQQILYTFLICLSQCICQISHQKPPGLTPEGFHTVSY